MTEEIIDPGLLEQTKNQIRKLVAEIADLAESDIQPTEFYVEFLNRAVAAVAAIGRRVLDDGRSGRPQTPVSGRVPAVTGLMDGRVKTAARTTPSSAACSRRRRPQIIPPGAVIEGVPNAGNPTEFSLIIAPLHGRQAGRRPARDPDGSDPPCGHSRRARSGSSATSATWPATYLKNRQMRQMMSQQRLWNQLEGLHAPDPRLARPEGDRLRRRQRRQAAGRLRSARAWPSRSRRPDAWSRPSAARKSSSSGPTWSAS